MNRRFELVTPETGTLARDRDLAGAERASSAGAGAARAALLLEKRVVEAYLGETCRACAGGGVPGRRNGWGGGAGVEAERGGIASWESGWGSETGEVAAALVTRVWARSLARLIHHVEHYWACKPMFGREMPFPVFCFKFKFQLIKHDFQNPTKKEHSISRMSICNVKYVLVSCWMSLLLTFTC
jgi:hypothetical protein